MRLHIDDSTASLAVGSVPTGLTLSHSAVVWDDGHELLPEESFVGFTTDNILITGRFTTAEDVQQQNIRDGCIAGQREAEYGGIQSEYRLYAAGSHRAVR